jgi:hypothetical protein
LLSEGHRKHVDVFGARFGTRIRPCHLCPNSAVNLHHRQIPSTPGKQLRLLSLRSIDAVNFGAIDEVAQGNHDLAWSDVGITRMGRQHIVQ